jgi:hypothetical protein
MWRPIPIQPWLPSSRVLRRKKPFTLKHASSVCRRRTRYKNVPCCREHQKQQTHMPITLSPDRQKQHFDNDKNSHRRRYCTPNKPTETPSTSPTDIHGEDSTLVPPSVNISRPAELYHLTILLHNMRGMKESRDINGTQANSKLEYITLYMDNKGIEFYMVQETWRLEGDLDHWIVNGITFFTYGRGKTIFEQRPRRISHWLIQKGNESLDPCRKNRN